MKLRSCSVQRRLHHHHSVELVRVLETSRRRRSQRHISAVAILTRQTTRSLVTQSQSACDVRGSPLLAMEEHSSHRPLARRECCVPPAAKHSVTKERSRSTTAPCTSRRTTAVTSDEQDPLQRRAPQGDAPMYDRRLYDDVQFTA